MTVRARRRLAMWGLILVASSAQATPARMAALLGNQLFEDDTDADTYPSVAGRYGRSVFLHLTGGAGTQAGLLYGGDRWLVGATYGTPPAYDDLGAIGSELGRVLLRPSHLINVQLVRRRDGWSVDGHLVEIHPEIGEAADGEEPRQPGCQVLAAERPQLLVTNLMVASAMLNALWQVVERGSVPYSEVFLDVIQNAARSRSWFRVADGAQ